MKRIECSALRCIAIICIMIHNYAHKMPGAAQENEFAYHFENDILKSFNPFSLITTV